MISVIIPTYNRANYIAECINTVLNQTYNDFEIIVVDDGSTDNTQEVLKPYMNKIKYIYQKNNGAANARNTGIKNAKGNYIAWLDSDDRWLPFKLELQMEVFKRLSSVGLVFSDFSCFTNDKGKIAESYIREYFYVYNTHKFKYDTLFSHNASLRELGINILDKDIMVYWGNIFEKLILGQMFPTDTVIIKKEYVNKTGLFNEDYKSGEAFDFHARIAKQVDVAFIDLPTMEYRRFHAGQLSALDMEVESNLAWLDAGLRLWYGDKEYFAAHKRTVSLGISQFYCGLGAAYFKKGRYNKALPNFFKSINFNFKQKRIYLYIILAFLKLLAKR